GLRPSEAARLATEKVPNPTRRTSPPPFKAPVIDSNTASTALPAAVFDRSAFPATASTSSFLFTCRPLPLSSEEHAPETERECRAPPPMGQRWRARRNQAFFCMLPAVVAGPHEVG